MSKGKRMPNRFEYSAKREDFYRKHGLLTEPSHNGQQANRGRIEIGSDYQWADKEGYAIIKCGGTEIKIPYTILHNLRFEIHANHPFWGEVQEIIRAFDSIKCEAMLGYTGEDK